MRRKREAEVQAAETSLGQEIDDLVSVLAHYPGGKRPTFGAPSRCPGCGDFGLVDQVDQGRGRCHNRCMTCKQEWVVSVAALSEVARWRAAKPAYQGSGALTAALAAAAESEAERPVARPTAWAPAPTPFFARVIQSQIRPA